MLTNPTLIGGSVPGLAAANSGKVTAIPVATPPATPRSSGAVSGVKRDASESEKEEAKEPKRRRVAPTPVQDPKA